jgi:hypothetical protein
VSSSSGQSRERVDGCHLPSLSPFSGPWAGPARWLRRAFWASPARKSDRGAMPGSMSKNEARPRHGPTARRALPGPPQSGRAWLGAVPGLAGRSEQPSLLGTRLILQLLEYSLICWTS